MPPSISQTRSSGAPLGIAGAVMLHVGIVAATFLTWSHRLDIQDQTPVVPVDLVTLADKTNVTAMVKQQPKAPPKEEEQPPAPEPAPTPQAAAPAPQQEEAPPPEQTEAPVKLAKPLPQPKIQPVQKPEEKKSKFDLDNIAALLDKRAPAASSAPTARAGARNIKGIGAQNAMTADLISMLASQIYRCWSPPVGAPNAGDLTVSFELFLTPDGNVAQPPQLKANSVPAGGESYARAAVEAARRAIYTCAPYQLPADRYGQWSDVTLNFRPGDFVGQ
jgi:outer membrane biosynthesis protein TonB